MKTNWILCTIGLVLLISTGQVTGQTDGYQIGDVATDFSLKNVDGNMVSLKGNYPEANGYIVIFTCNHCPYAVLYEDRIKDLQSNYEAQGYPVIAINPNDPEVVPEDSYQGMIQRAAEKEFNFPYLFDEGQNVYPIYGAKKTPHVYLLDNNLVVKYIGAIDDNPRNPDAVEIPYLANAIENLKQGQDPDPSSTKAIGCTIKVKS